MQAASPENRIYLWRALSRHLRIWRERFPSVPYGTNGKREWKPIFWSPFWLFVSTPCCEILCVGEPQGWYPKPFWKKCRIFKWLMFIYQPRMVVTLSWAAIHSQKRMFLSFWHNGDYRFTNNRRPRFMHQDRSGCSADLFVRPLEFAGLAACIPPELRRSG